MYMYVSISIYYLLLFRDDAYKAMGSRWRLIPSKGPACFPSPVPLENYTLWPNRSPKRKLYIYPATTSA